MEILPWIFIGLLLVGQIGLFLRISRIAKKIDKALGGAKSKSIMKMLAHAMERYEVVEKDFKRIFEEDAKNKDLMRSMVQKVGVVRFNPFADMGGEQSFCIALMDGEDDGVLLTYLHSKDGGKSYIKKMKKGESEYALSEEEKKALKEANK
ncbi:MAG: DUF4446 family protein [Candidatus Spechtbacterales bacterium]